MQLSLLIATAPVPAGHDGGLDSSEGRADAEKSVNSRAVWELISTTGD